MAGPALWMDNCSRLASTLNVQMSQQCVVRIKWDAWATAYGVSVNGSQARDALVPFVNAANR